MVTKEHAIERIEEIHKVITSSFLVKLPAKLLISVGLAIMAIPLVEIFFGKVIDPWLAAHGATMFVHCALRLVLYWGSFFIIGYKTSPKADEIHPLINKVWGINEVFPVIPIATAAALGFAGQIALIQPIILILLGMFWGFIGRFTSIIITILSVVMIIAGLIGIILTSYSIPHLWKYLLTFQGLSCLVAGLALLEK